MLVKKTRISIISGHKEIDSLDSAGKIGRKTAKFSRDFRLYWSKNTFGNKSVIPIDIFGERLGGAQSIHAPPPPPPGGGCNH